MSVESAKIAVVRAGLDDDRAEKILGFLSSEGGLNEEAARRRLSEAVAVAIDGGEVVALNSVRPAGLQLVGGRRFWIYDSVVAQDSERLWDRLFNAAFTSLSDEFVQNGDGCIGVCALIAGRSEIGRRPEAIWPETELLFAGHLEDGRQVRIRYFHAAKIGPGLPDTPSFEQMRDNPYPLAEGYRLEPLGEAEVTPDDVLALWSREGAVPEPEAKRRVDEVTLVGSAPDGSVAGVSTLFLRNNPQLRMELWNYRTYVAEQHRYSGLAAQLFFTNRKLMDERYVTGQDRRAEGMLFELENEGMRKYFNYALWLPGDFTFIGESERGAHVRVHWFPGARLPWVGGASSR